jgi:hypothetical protein
MRGCTILDRGCESASEIEEVEDACHTGQKQIKKVACGSGWNEKTMGRCDI